MPKRRNMKRHSVTQPLDKPYRYIPLTQGQNAIVDAADFEWLNGWTWHAHWSPSTQSFYASRGERIGSILKTVPMHRFILACNSTQEADHRNHDTLDNRRQNLRKVARHQNMANRRKWNGKFKGISFHHGKWVARIQTNKINIRIGIYETAECAARAYDEAAKRLHGEFAYLNFPTTLDRTSLS